MYYVKFMLGLRLKEAEDKVNTFYKEIQAKGHRVMHATFKRDDMYMDVIVTLDDRAGKRKHEKEG